MVSEGIPRYLSVTVQTTAEYLNWWSIDIALRWDATKYALPMLQRHFYGVFSRNTPSVYTVDDSSSKEPYAERPSWR